MLLRLLADDIMLQVLYLSRRALTCQVQALGELAERSRLHNAEVGVTGALLFDGSHFSQYLEGPAAAVEALLDRIRVDPRHEQFRVLHRAALPGGRRFEGWSMVYAVTDAFQADSDGLAQLERLEGPSAVAAFVRWTPAWCRPAP